MSLAAKLVKRWWMIREYWRDVEATDRIALGVAMPDSAASAAQAEFTVDNELSNPSPLSS